jgi:hypothetical protein
MHDSAKYCLRFGIRESAEHELQAKSKFEC